MASDRYEWIAHRAAVERLVKLAGRERAAVLERLRLFAQSPNSLEGEKGFSLPNEAPFFVVQVNKHILTLQIDHAVKELRLLALE